jgi:peptidyl-prolyl cis-trans isomerase B (cyclophilin B)
MANKTRQRQLAELRARREAERKAARRRRALLTYGTLAAVIILVVVGVVVITRIVRDDTPTPAAATPTTEAAPTDARADAPTAPATVACGAETPPRKPRPTFKAPPTPKLAAGKTYSAIVSTSCGAFTIKLDPASAPKTVAAIVGLAQKNFYDSTWFHRIVPGGAAGIGVIQGGDPQGTGAGGPGYDMAEEKPKGATPYARYTVAMAKSSAPSSTGSQFFVNTQDNSKALQPDYTVIGTVTDGRAVIDQIAQVPTAGESGDTPTEAVWIESFRIKVS